MENKNFIFTSDKETSEALSELGFQLIQHTSDGYLFYNNAAIPHNFKHTKVTFTNKIFI